MRRVWSLSQISIVPPGARTRMYSSIMTCCRLLGTARDMSFTITRSNSPSWKGQGNRRISCCTKRHFMSLSGRLSGWSDGAGRLLDELVEVPRPDAPGAIGATSIPVKAISAWP